MLSKHHRAQPCRHSRAECRDCTHVQVLMQHSQPGLVQSCVRSNVNRSLCPNSFPYVLLSFGLYQKVHLWLGRKSLVIVIALTKNLSHTSATSEMSALGCGLTSKFCFCLSPKKVCIPVLHACQKCGTCLLSTVTLAHALRSMTV